MSPARRSVHLLWKAAVLPFKLLIDTGEFTFRAGVKVGGLPVRGSRAALRALGWKLAIALGLGVVVGFVVGREMERRLHALSHHDDHSHEVDDALGGRIEDVA